MIELTKLNGSEIVINPDQIECIEVIPETKVIMMNGRYHIVQESAGEIIEKAIAYSARAGRTCVHRIVEQTEAEQETESAE